MKIAGFDLGLNGAVAAIELTANGPRLITAYNMPTIGLGSKRRPDAIALQELIFQLEPQYAFVEIAQAYPKQGVASAFRFGRAAGLVEGIITVCAIPIEYISAAQWKKHFGLSADKEQARALAISRFPTAHALFSKKGDHNKAEAALLALFGASRLPTMTPVVPSPAAAAEVAS